MKKITPLKDKVLARMIDGFGEHTTDGGLIIQETEGTSESIRPRWFKVVAVGPDQTDVSEGEYILVPHGRWTRGIDVDGTKRKEDLIFNIDMEAAMAINAENPLRKPTQSFDEYVNDLAKDNPEFLSAYKQNKLK